MGGKKERQERYQSFQLAVIIAPDIFEALEVERSHASATGETDLQVAFVYQAVERVPKRRTRYAKTLRHFVFREALAGQQSEAEDIDPSA